MFLLESCWCQRPISKERGLKGESLESMVDQAKQTKQNIVTPLAVSRQDTPWNASLVPSSVKSSRTSSKVKLPTTILLAKYRYELTADIVEGKVFELF